MHIYSLERGELEKYRAILKSLFWNGAQSEYRLAMTTLLEGKTLNRTTIMRIMNKVSRSNIRFFETKRGDRRAKIHEITMRGILYLYNEKLIEPDAFKKEFKRRYEQLLGFKPLHRFEEEILNDAIELMMPNLTEMPNLEYVDDEYIKLYISKMMAKYWNEAFIKAMGEPDTFSKAVASLTEVLKDDIRYERLRGRLMEMMGRYQMEIMELAAKLSEVQKALERLEHLRRELTGGKDGSSGS